ncbi:P-loop containing nucleoside triphosphate hydrolase protein [Trichoderma compactum]
MTYSIQSRLLDVKFRACSIRLHDVAIVSSAHVIKSNTIGKDARSHQGNVIYNYASAPRELSVIIPFHRNKELICRQDITSKLDRILPLFDDTLPLPFMGLAAWGKYLIALDYAYRWGQIPSYSVFWLIAKKLGLLSNLVGEDLLMAVRHGIKSNYPWVLILDNIGNLRLFSLSYTRQNALNLSEDSCNKRIAGGLIVIQRAKKLFNSVRNNPLLLAILQAAAYIRRTLITVKDDCYQRQRHIQVKNKINIPAKLIKQAAFYSDNSNGINYIHKTHNNNFLLTSDSNNKVTKAIAYLYGNHVYKLGRKEQKNIENYFSAAALEIAYSLFLSSPYYITYAQQSWLGRYTKVEKMRIEIYQQRREILGNKDLKTIRSETKLATTHYMLKRFKQAEEIKVRALTLLQEIHGTTHHDIMIAMRNLAITYNALGKYLEETFGHKHHLTVNTMANISASHQSHGRYQEAETLGLEVLALRREILGDQDPNTIENMANLGITYRAAGKYRDAEEIQAKALALRREVLGDKHPDTISTMASLGKIYHALGRYQEAETLKAEVLALRQEVLGDEHPDTKKILRQLARTRRQLERLNIEEG